MATGAYFCYRLEFYNNMKTNYDKLMGHDLQNLYILHQNNPKTTLTDIFLYKVVERSFRWKDKKHIKIYYIFDFPNLFKWFPNVRNINMLGTQVAMLDRYLF